MESDFELDDYTAADPLATPEAVWMTVPEACAGLRLDHVLQQMLPEYSRSRLQQWLKAGHITVDGRSRSAKDKISGGELLEIHPQLDPVDSAFVPEPMDLDIVYEDESLLVLNKPAGLVVHPGSGNWTGTLLNGLLHARPELAAVPRAGIVHRLDKDTSGLMVVARTIQAQTNLVRQLQARTVKREYQAVANGLMPEQGTVDAPIGRHPSERTRMAVHPLGKPAVTHFEVLGWFRGHTLVRCRLETGRTHQIRVHLQSLGHFLAADPVYGGRIKVDSPILKEAIKNFGRQALHAERLGLIHPLSGEAMSWEAPLPDDMLQLLDALTEDFHLHAPASGRGD